MRKEIKEKLYVCFYMILFFSIIPYDITKVFPSSIGNYILLAFRFIVLVYGILLIFSKGKININKKYTVATSLFFAALLSFNIISSVMNDISYIDLLKRTLSILFIYFCLIIIIINKKNKEYIMLGLKYSTIFLIVFSIYLYYRVPELGKYYAGLGKYTFLGIANNRNGYIEFALASIISIIFLYNGRNKMLNIILILIISYTVLLTESSTSLIIIILSFIVLLFEKAFKEKFNYRIINKVIVVVWIIFLSFIAFHRSFGYIGTILNRSSTLTGRTEIWSQSIIEIKKHPFFGYGYDNSVLKNIGLSTNSKLLLYNDSHNAVLYILLCSGILGLLTTLLYLCFLIRNIEINKKNRYIYIYIISFLIRGLVESCLHYPHVLFYIFLILCVKDEDFTINN